MNIIQIGWDFINNINIIFNFFKRYFDQEFIETSFMDNYGKKGINMQFNRSFLSNAALIVFVRTSELIEEKQAITTLKLGVVRRGNIWFDSDLSAPD